MLRLLEQFFVWIALYYSRSTLEMVVASVGAAYKWNGIRNPCRRSAVRAVVAGLRKSGRISSKTPKFVVDAALVVRMAQAFCVRFPVFDEDIFDPFRKLKKREVRAVKALRGLCMILVGVEAALRPSEVVNLTCCCWILIEEGIRLLTLAAKNNTTMLKELSENELVRAAGSFETNMSAISLVEEFWIKVLKKAKQGVSAQCTRAKYPYAQCDHCSPLFPSFSNGTCKGLDMGEVSKAVKYWAEEIGLEPKHYSAVSFRRGSVSEAAAAKLDRDIRQKHMRHKSGKTQDIYIERSKKDRQAVGLAWRSSVLQAAKNKKKVVKFRV